MSATEEGKGARRLLWALVLGVVLLNVVLFLVYSRQRGSPQRPGAAAPTGVSHAATNAPVR